MNEQHFIELLYRNITRPWVTLALIVANVGVYAWLVAHGGNAMNFDSQQLIAYGALSGPVTLQGQWWRILSAIFLHGGLLHIAINMFALWQVGVFVERLFGHRNFLIVYLGAGLSGSFASLWWKPTVLSVGASGAIFGLYGALFGFMLAEHAAMPRELMRELRSSALTFVGFSLFAGFAMPGIDNAAHIGGLVGGLVLGAAFARPLDRSERLTDVLRALVGVAVVGALCAAAWFAVQPAAAAFRKADAAERSVRAFAFADETLTRRTTSLFEGFQRGEISEDAALSVIEHELIPGWEEQVNALASQASDSSPVHDDLLHYAEARRNAATSLAQAIRTKDRHVLDQAINWKLQAENILLTMQLRQAAAGQASAPSPGQ